MSFPTRHRWIFMGLGLLLPFVIYLHFQAGQTVLSLQDFWNALFHFSDSDTEQVIIRELRLPRICIAMIAGSALSVAGMLMQTLFQNPLAGPYVLGINSGSSLLVAIATLSGITWLNLQIGLIALSVFGAFVFSMLILFISHRIRSNVSLLLIGLMLSSFTGSIIAILQSTSSAQALQQFTMWTMGSLQQVSFSSIGMIFGIFLCTITLLLWLIKPLNALILGERQAAHLGIHVSRTRWLIILVTALLTGLVTAYCGPIAFVGLAIPNFSRLLFRTQHHGVLLVACILLGALFLLCCDVIILLLESWIVIPINAFTSLIGAPFVVFLVIRRLT
jgi:iron complex transport system permease protein